MCIDTFDENHNEEPEIWDDFESSDENEFTLPIVPKKTISEEDAKAKAIVNWTVGFLLILQARYYISNAAMDFLVKFFYIILKILGQSSSLPAKMGKAFFTSFNMLCKHIDHESPYLKYIVCLNCNQIYHLQQCIYSVGLQQYSKKCSFVEFPNHPHIRRRQPCGFLLLRTVEISSRPKKCYFHSKFIAIKV